MQQTQPLHSKATHKSQIKEQQEENIKFQTIHHVKKKSADENKQPEQLKAGSEKGIFPFLVRRQRDSSFKNTHASHIKSGRLETKGTSMEKKGQDQKFRQKSNRKV